MDHVQTQGIVFSDNQKNKNQNNKGCPFKTVIVLIHRCSQGADYLLLMEDIVLNQC